jgi:17beta-estradiol 17-dehydrogenase / very-long-chain 3-oxoacyl-CoA reductase
LGAELSPHGVTVQLVQSYLVTSAMSKIRLRSALVPTAREFVTEVLGKVGRSGGAQGWAYTSAPYWSHGLVAWGLGLIGYTREWVVKWNKDMHEGIRKRALRKRERVMERERGAGKKIA